MDYKRDYAREDLFHTAYRIKPEVYIKYELNPDRTFETFELKFKLKNKEWILTENYKDNTNMTDFCTLTGEEGNIDKFYKAELKLVEKMRDGNTD